MGNFFFGNNMQISSNLTGEVTFAPWMIYEGDRQSAMDWKIYTYLYSYQSIEFLATFLINMQIRKNGTIIDKNISNIPRMYKEKIR